MKKELYFLLSLTLTNSVFAQTAQTNTSSTSVPKPQDSAANNYTMSWIPSFKSFRTEDSTKTESNSFVFYLKLKYDTSFSETLSMNLTPRLTVISGYVQGPIAEDPKKNSVDLKNASLDYTPSENFKFSVGALNQLKLHSKLFITGVAFPSIRAMTMTSDPLSQFSAFGEGALLTSYAINSDSKDSVANSTPSLLMGGVGYNYGDFKKPFSLQLAANYFQYNNLSDQVATDSAPSGNSTRLLSDGKTYRFTYAYQGAEASLSSKLRLYRPFAVGINSSGLLNSQAPTGYNSAYSISGFVEYDFTKKVKIIPSLEYFKVEPDATVAKYNVDTYSTNRQGYNTEFRLNYLRKVEIFLGYGERKAIYVNPSQPNEIYYSFGVETENAANY